MRAIEEKYLKSSINMLNKFIKSCDDDLDFYEKIDSLNLKSLQSLSYKNDSDALDEISFILSVIISIISNPRISSKSEDIIIRTELANRVTNDMLKMTMRDSRLWNNNVPQYVYYYQNVDEIKIYENIFIVMLIKKINSILAEYNLFYNSLIKSFTINNELSLKGDMQYQMIKKIDKLFNKVRHIENTYFYKVINKSGAFIRNIMPTNILLKNRLYNYCYRFYLKNISYLDKSDIIADLKEYYYVLLIKSLKKKGFIYENSKFKNDFIIQIEKLDKGISLSVEKNKIKAKHLLLFDYDEVFKSCKNADGYDTVEALSIWNYAHIDEFKIITFNNLNEFELIENWLNKKISVTEGSGELYSVYCPVCKTRDLDEIKKTTKCNRCDSKFVLYTENRKSKIWFIKIRG